MRLPVDKPSVAASLKHRPLFTPLIFPMLGFIVVLLSIIWLALAYQQTTTVILAVWDETAVGDRGALFRLAGQVEADAAYAVDRSPFGDMALILPGDPMPVRPMESIPAMVDNIGNGSLLLLVSVNKLPAVMEALDVSMAGDVDVTAGSLLVIAIPRLGQASVLRILPGEELRQD